MTSIKTLTKLVAWVTIVMVAYGPFISVLQIPKAFAGCPDGMIDASPYFPGSSNCIPKTPDAHGNSALYDSNGNAIMSTNKCDGITGCIGYVVYLVTVGISSYIASWAAIFFNFMTKLTLTSTAYALGFLTTSWTLVLSLANMFFIFILIYLAFVIMLKAETVRTMQVLAWVIAIALIVNFSFFITRTVIDGGNILAVQFYNVIVSDPATQVANGNPDLSKPIMAAIGVDQLLGKGFDAFQYQVGSDWGALLIAIIVFLATAIMLIILAWSFFMVGIKFLLRIVGLWLIIVSSPIAFVAKTLNGTKHLFDMWLRALVSLSLYPAVFLLMFYMLLLMTGQIQGIIGLGQNLVTPDLAAQTGGLPASAKAGQDLTNLIAQTSVAMSLMVAVLYLMLKVSDWLMAQMGGVAATVLDRAGSAIGNVGLTPLRFAGRQTGRLGGFGYQQTVGRGANAIDRRLAGSLWANQGGLRGWLGYKARQGTQAVAQSRVGGARSFREFQTAQSTRRRDQRQNTRDILNRDLINRLAAQGAHTLTDDEVRRIENFRQRELESLGGQAVQTIAQNSIPNTRTARFFSDNRMNSLRNSAVFNDAQIEAIYRAWQQAQQQGHGAAAPQQNLNPGHMQVLQQATQRIVQVNNLLQNRPGNRANRNAAQTIQTPPGNVPPPPPQNPPTNTPPPHTPPTPPAQPMRRESLERTRQKFGSLNAATSSLKSEIAKSFNTRHEAADLEPLRKEIHKLRETIKQSNEHARHETRADTHGANIERSLKTIARQITKKENPQDPHKPEVS